MPSSQLSFFRDGQAELRQRCCCMKHQRLLTATPAEWRQSTLQAVQSYTRVNYEAQVLCADAAEWLCMPS